LRAWSYGSSARESPSLPAAVHRGRWGLVVPFGSRRTPAAAPLSSVRFHSIESIVPTLSLVIPHWPLDEETNEALRRCVSSFPGTKPTSKTQMRSSPPSDRTTRSSPSATTRSSSRAPRLQASNKQTPTRRSREGSRKHSMRASRAIRSGACPYATEPTFLPESVLSGKPSPRSTSLCRRKNASSSDRA
jgi:hypothetical protein